MTCWDAAHNPVGRAKVLQDIAGTRRPVVLFAYLFAEFGGGAHVSRPFHLQTRATGDAFSLEPADAGQGDEVLAEASYPSFLSAESGELFLLYRVGHPARSAWRVCRWRADVRTWEDRSFPLLSGITSDAWPVGPYINTPLRERGGRFGFFVVWRSESLAGSRRRVFNTGIDYLEADLAGSALFAHSGAQETSLLRDMRSLRRGIFPVSEPWEAPSQPSGVSMLSTLGGFPGNTNSSRVPVRTRLAEGAFRPSRAPAGRSRRA